MNTDFDLVVVGGGSGGFGAALAAARHGLRVLLVEAGPILGGTSTLAGVNTWEPGISGPGFPKELFDRLSQHPGAIGLSRNTKIYSPDKPWALSEIDDSLTYGQSLRRAGVQPYNWVRVTFEPRLMAREMEAMVVEAGARVALNTRFIAAVTEGDRITELMFSSPQGQWKTRPQFVIDSTAGLHLSRYVGCSTRWGEESKDVYNEPSAPLEAKKSINGVSLCFRIESTAGPCITPLPVDVNPDPFRVSVNMTQYPNGDLNMNPLPVMQGVEYETMLEQVGPIATRRECEHRVLRIWHWLQTEYDFASGRIKEIFPMAGVREGARLLGRKVLTERDVRAGWQKQEDADRIIALADHALDVHGEGHLCRELDIPYGIPYDCLLPREYSNLAVACRGASFSHITASTCRLSRTMMDLGHAAGLAVALASEHGIGFPDVDVNNLREQLRNDNVCLQSQLCQSLDNNPNPYTPNSARSVSLTNLQGTAGCAAAPGSV